MRTDATIDRKQVSCPNASHLGFDKWKAQVGDILTYHDGSAGALKPRVARMIGRIAYAPALGTSPAISNHILAVVLSDDLSFTMERWIDPKDVLRVQAIRDHRAVMEWFLSDDMAKSPVDEVRQSTEQGWTTIHKFRARKAKRDADLAEYESREKCDVCGMKPRQKANPTCIDCTLIARVDAAKSTSEIL